MPIDESSRELVDSLAAQAEAERTPAGLPFRLLVLSNKDADTAECGGSGCAGYEATAQHLVQWLGAQSSATVHLVAGALVTMLFDRQLRAEAALADRNGEPTS